MSAVQTFIRLPLADELRLIYERVRTIPEPPSLEDIPALQDD